MELNEYQKRAHATAVFPSGEKGLAYLGLQKASEAGEVAGKLAKYFRGDYENAGAVQMDEFKRALVLELGDDLWYIAALARFFGVDLEDVALKNLDKLKDRADRGVIKGSGDNR